MKIVAVVIGAILALYLFLVNFSTAETRYACTGTLTGANVQTNSKVFVRLDEYRFWVGFWSKSDGQLFVEVPSQSVGYFSHLTKAGDTYGVFDSAGGAFAGNFFKLSGQLNLKISEKLIFDGTCTAR